MEGTDAPLSADLTTSEVGAPDSVDAAPPPSFDPPPAAPAITPEALAQANYQTFGPLLQSLAPKPVEQKPDPAARWARLNGLNEAQLHGEYDAEHRRLAREEAKAEMAEQLKSFEQRVAQALAERDAEFRARFASDPTFSRIEATYQKYRQEGIPAQYARRLAEQDAGVSRAAAPAASGPKAVPMPPRHASSPAARTVPGQGAQKNKINVFDKKQLEGRMHEIAAQFFPEEYA